MWRTTITGIVQATSWGWDLQGTTGVLYKVWERWLATLIIQTKVQIRSIFWCKHLSFLSRRSCWACRQWRKLNIILRGLSNTLNCCRVIAGFISWYYFWIFNCIIYASIWAAFFPQYTASITSPLGLLKESCWNSNILNSGQFISLHSSHSYW